MNATERTARAQRFLAEMGLTPVWLTRAPSSELTQAEIEAASPAGAVAIDHTEEATLAATPTFKPPLQEQTQSRPVNSPAASAWDFDDLLDASDAVNKTVPSSPIPSTHFIDERYAPEAIAQMNWATLKETVAGCVKCDLCKTRTKTVFGTGDEKAEWLFIGEGPGRNEDIEGEPFVGPAGKLLDNILLSLDVQRGNRAYIANVVKCRPTDQNGRDRAPTQEEASACLPYLQRQIELLQPKVLVALGKTAAISLLGLDPDTPVGKLRGTTYRYGNLPLVVTYHPAYLLRRLDEKAKVWTDLCLALDVIKQPDTSGKQGA